MLDAALLCFFFFSSFKLFVEQDILLLGEVVGLKYTRYACVIYISVSFFFVSPLAVSS